MSVRPISPSSVGGEKRPFHREWIERMSDTSAIRETGLFSAMAYETVFLDVQVQRTGHAGRTAINRYCMIHPYSPQRRARNESDTDDPVREYWKCPLCMG